MQYGIKQISFQNIAISELDIASYKTYIRAWTYER